MMSMINSYQDFVAPETFLDTGQFKDPFSQIVFFSFQFANGFIFFLHRLKTKKKRKHFRQKEKSQSWKNIH